MTRPYALIGLVFCTFGCSADGGPFQAPVGPQAGVVAGVTAPVGVPGASGVGGVTGAGSAGVAGQFTSTAPPPPPPPPAAIAGSGDGAGRGTGIAGTTAAAGTSAVAGTTASAGRSASAGGGAPVAGSGGGTGVPPAPGTVQFSPNVRVNDDTGKGQQTEVVMAAHSNGSIVVGYIDNRSTGPKCGFSISSDFGQTWGKNFFTDPKGTGTRPFTGDPAVAIDDSGNIYVGCQDYGTPKSILLASSTDAGKTVSAWRAVNSSIDKPWLGAARDGTVFLSWLGFPGGFKRSLDYGQTWGNTLSLGNLSSGTGISGGDSGVVHIAYNQGDYLRYVRSKDWGATIDMGRNLTQQGKPCYDPCSPRSHPIVGNASDPTGKVVAITWASTLTGGDGNDDVWVVISRDGGDTFTKPIRVNDNPTASRQFQPWVAVDRKGRVHVAWTDLRKDNKNATYYARMSDPDKGFEPNIEVTDQRGSPASFLGDYKGLAVQGNDIVVTWQDTRRDTGDIYFSRAVGAAAD